MEHEQEEDCDRGGETDEVNERSRKGCAALAAFIPTHVALERVVHCGVLFTFGKIIFGVKHCRSCNFEVQSIFRGSSVFFLRFWRLFFLFITRPFGNNVASDEI